MFHNSIQNRVTVFTGLGKGSGKTSALQATAVEAQRVGAVGLFTIGFGGGGKSLLLRVERGDVVITSIPLLRASEARLDIIEALPGRSAIGQLCVCSVVRPGAVTLAGPEHLSQLAQAIGFILQDNLVKSVLVDGAAGRITQVAALPEAQFIYCAQADAANFVRVAENIEFISKLADLPLDAQDNRDQDNRLRIEGPLTLSMIGTIQDKVEHISIDTLSDCFLDPASFKRLSQRFKITARRRVPLLGFVVALKNIKRETFLDALPTASSRIIFNPYEVSG